MSLNIYFEGVDTLPNDVVVERDVEHLFGSIVLDGSANDQLFIQAIEQGKYLDDTRFVDRFGTTLYLDCLSTGAKAALSLYHRPDVIIWCGEIGCNALTQMVKYCTNGAILVHADCHFVYGLVEDVTIDVEARGRRYTLLNDLAKYMMEEAPL